MCGICGILSLNKETGINEKLLDSMCEILRHRGPDDGGKYLGPGTSKGAFKIGLGHRRLAIVDPVTGRQPIHNEKHNLWIVCDGEIYNFHELRKECEEKGHSFYTKSDTETIVHLYEDYGVDCVKYLRGMFAFAIWDAEKRMLFLARDHLGIKPLCYSFFNNNFIFASEAKAILLHPDFKRSLNRESFFHYLSFSTLPAPFTLFEGICKLPAGFRLQLSENGKCIKEEYWDIFDEKGTVSLRSENDYVRYISDSLDAAVKYQAAENVPSGVFLSGGTDSSLLTGYLSKYIRPIKTFTTGFGDKGLGDKFEYAQEISRLFNTEHHEILLGPEHFENRVFQELLYYNEEPINPACVPYYFTARLARAKGILVSYTGEGSDELFYGYGYWQRVLQFKKYLEFFSRLPSFIRGPILSSFGSVFNKSSYKYEALRRTHNQETLFWGSLDYFTEYEKESLLNKKLCITFGSKVSSELINKFYRKFQENSDLKDYGCFMSYLDLKIKMPESFLMRMDRMAMANSIEVRVPFLDHKFVGTAIRLPKNLKIKKKASKYILKKITDSAIPIPKKCIYRNKKGWGSEASRWYLGASGSNDIIKNKVMSFVNRNNLLNSEYIVRLLHMENSIRDKMKTWQIFSFILWYERWIESK